jgi:hypothetical protein
MVVPTAAPALAPAALAQLRSTRAIPFFVLDEEAVLAPVEEEVNDDDEEGAFLRRLLLISETSACSFLILSINSCRFC